MNTNDHTVTIETSVDGIYDAVVKAGFLPGRQVTIQVRYVSDDDAYEPEHERIATLLRHYPVDPAKYAGMTEGEAIDFALGALVEDIKKSGPKEGKRKIGAFDATIETLPIAIKELGIGIDDKFDLIIHAMTE